ncbi:hypothetical protein C2845_PM13G13010 [Panicum miliaceum]|uniref:Uncharacterized protein n=1 Tax=Panicum miliaceum TaxID=4540 RepID=A0A3L6RG54_PANMI|nr:hypothetical protein C2845_PM13G13010 [Panicum miliaceum]
MFAELQHHRRPRATARSPPSRATALAPPPTSRSCGARAASPELRHARAGPSCSARTPPRSCGTLAAGPSCGARAPGLELWPGRRQPQAAVCSPPPLPSSDLSVILDLHGVPPLRAGPSQRKLDPLPTSAASVHLLRCPHCRSSRHLLLLCGLRTSVTTSRCCRPSPAGRDSLRLIQEGAEHGIQCDSTSGKLTT